MQAYEELSNGRAKHGVSIHHHLWLKDVLYKAKKDEYSKVGKNMRMIGDLGVGASLQGFRITEYLKIAQSEARFEWLGGVAYFCKAPEPSELQTHFENLATHNYKLLMLYFSDDSTLSWVTKAGVRVYGNMDISGCDASHTEALFEGLVLLVPPAFHGDVQKLVDQCKLPIKIVCHNLEKEKDGKPMKVKIQFNEATLYSGSTITTAINNLACILIFVAIMEDGGHITTRRIIRAAQRAGYKVTITTSTRLEDVQFLKNSPVYVNELKKHIPVLNLGVLLRTSGTCKGDLPGRGSIQTRAKVFQGLLLNGMYPRTKFTLVENMKKQCHTPDTLNTKTIKLMQNMVRDQLDRKLTTSSDPVIQLDDAHIYKRYDLSIEEIAMINNFGNTPVGMGHSAANAALDKILSKDYDGLTSAKGFNRQRFSYWPGLYTKQTGIREDELFD